MAQGILYVVATPIGNLEDFTFRAVRVLKDVDVILAEDTRHTRQLLTHYQIRKPVMSYHQFTEERSESRYVKWLEEGKSLALVSDAGTPGISDPGSRIIGLAIERGAKVVPIPGPTALAAALTVCGLPLHQFLFAGFLNPKSGRRKKQLEGLQWESSTLVLYEAPHRLAAMLQDALAVMGNRKAAVARELTKMHEEVVRGSLVEIVDHFSRRPPRGEMVVIIEGFQSDRRGADAAPKEAPSCVG